MIKEYTALEMREMSEAKWHMGEKTVCSMLRQAAEMRERCEEMLKQCRLEDAPCVPSDDGYCDSCDVPKHNELINYILRGDAGKEEK